MVSIIPVQAIPNHKFSSRILVDNQNLTLQFELQYNDIANYWLVNINDHNGRALISCLPVIPAQNILEQYAHLQIGSAYIVPVQTIKEQWPTQHTLDSEWYLLWSDTVAGEKNG